MILTRKIQVVVNEPEKTAKGNHYQTLRKWLHICMQSANITSTHLFAQDNIKDFIYLSEEVKMKLADAAKDDAGMLSTSYRNTCYQVLSGRFKGEIPSDIFSNLKDIIFKTYKEEKGQYYSGERSLRNYKTNVPIPFSSSSVEFKAVEKDVQFSFFKIPMVFLFGRDRSGNRLVIDRITSGEYKMSNSSLMYDKRKNKWFMLVCVDIPKHDYTPKEGKTVYASLGLDVPIVMSSGNNSIEIGNKEEYLHQRLQIQYAMQRLQKDLRFVKSGEGRKSKLQALDRFSEKEKNYIKTRVHTYSKLLVMEAKRQHAETIVLVDQEAKEEEARKDEFLLRNWGYYGLNTLIEYKAKQTGIKVVKQ